MNTLQKIFEKEIETSISFPAVGAKIIKRQLEKRGVFLSEKQMQDLRHKLEKIKEDEASFSFELDDNQAKALGVSDGENFALDLGGTQELDQIFEKLTEQLQSALPEIIKEMTTPILEDLKKTTPSMLKAHRKDLRTFERRLYRDWKKPFDQLEAFLVAAREAGDEFNREFRRDSEEKDIYLLDVLTRLHARGCQIAAEILILLKNGFADGAHARWRSLHELAVVGSFIKTYGNEVAERYLLHDKVESFRAANLHRKYSETLGEEPISQDEYDSIRTIYDHLLERFGASFKNNYGWAASALNKENPNFSDIEENAGLDHLRPYYKLASHNVHANPKGILFRLGLLKSSNNILLAGPSNVGFPDPGIGTVFSVGLLTATLLTTKPTIDNLVISNVLLKLEAEISEEFLRVQSEIEKRTNGDFD